MFEVLVPAGQKLAAPAHQYDAYGEILVSREFLPGRLTACPSKLVPGRRGAPPRGAVHRFDNLGSEDVKQLAVITPAIMGPAYFREAAEVISAVGSPPARR